MGMPIKYLLDPLPVGRVVPIHVRRHLGPLPLVQALQALLADLGGDLPIQVKGDDGDAVLAGVTQDGPIEAVVEAPALEIIRAPEHFFFADLPGDIGIQGGLEGLLEHFHADGQVQVLLMQAANDRQLIEVILIAVMGLAHEDDAAIGQLGHQGIQPGEGGGIHHPGMGVGDLVGGRGGRRPLLRQNGLREAKQQGAKGHRAGVGIHGRHGLLCKVAGTKGTGPCPPGGVLGAVNLVGPG
jgi:hypothetical protein